MDMGLKDVKLESAELEVHGVTAIEVGEYMLSLVNGQGRGRREVCGDLEERSGQLEAA
jgi:hypothetical protein